MHTDAAGNFWATLRGESEKALLIGGHMDSVPNGGWLDGCLNVLAGVEILRRINAQYRGKPPVTVRLVDWADEEGARFGKSLFGSSACSGNLDMDEARGLEDKEGITLPDALKAVGVDFERVKDSGKELKNAAAYLELHIEQGPVLLDLGFAARRGARDVRRRAARDHVSRAGGAFRQHADEPAQGRLSRRREDEPGDLPHRGAQRRRRLHHRLVHDQARHRHQRRRGMPHHARPAPSRRAALARMLQEAKEASEKFAREGNVRVAWERLWQIEPRPFIPNSSRCATRRSARPAARSHRLPSGPLHDAAEVAAPACRR
jgi:hypothetical protein